MRRAEPGVLKYSAFRDIGADVDAEDQLKIRLAEMQLEHRDLDLVINRLSAEPFPDQLQLRRLKKRKLLLKDQIAHLKSDLIPDLDA